MFQDFHSIPQRRDEGDGRPIGQRLKVERWELLLNYNWLASQALFAKQLPFNILHNNQIKNISLGDLVYSKPFSLKVCFVEFV